MLQAQSYHYIEAKYLIAVGSNLPSPTGSVSETVTVALELLSECESLVLIAQSRFFRTPAYPAGSGPEFVNAAVKVSSTLSPAELLGLLHQIESQMGRTRTTRWEARILDLDLLACEQRVLPNQTILDHWMNLPHQAQATEIPDQLILPHPRLHERGFVLVPLADIAPDWQHPRLGKSVVEMLGSLTKQDLAGIIPLDK